MFGNLTKRLAKRHGYPRKAKPVVNERRFSAGVAQDCESDFWRQVAEINRRQGRELAEALGECDE